MTTPNIEKLIEAVKYFSSSDENKVRPSTKPWTLKDAKAELLKLAQQAEDWKSPHDTHWHAANAQVDRSRNGRAGKAD
jgi:hypothetical protein